MPTTPHATTPSAKPGDPPSPADLLMRRVAQGKLTPQQQLDALRKTQTQAEQRVRLGIKLFEAAEGRLKSQNQALAELRENQQALREQMLADIRRTAADYDDRLDRLESRITDAVDSAEARITALEQAWQASETRLNRLVSQAQSLLEQVEQFTAPPPDAADVLTASSLPSDSIAPQAASIAQAPPPPPAASEEEAWNTVYHRALLWLGESATEPRNQPAKPTGGDPDSHP